MRDKQTPEWSETAALAEKGIRALQRDLLLLSAPDAAELDRAYRTLKRLHASAYDRSPPDVPGLERLGATRMRQYVRAWINAWDLVRLVVKSEQSTSAGRAGGAGRRHVSRRRGRGRGGRGRRRAHHP